TFVATDMLGDQRMAACFARSPISARCAALNPVVPITARAPAFATSLRCASDASGTENSISTRSRVISAAASAPTLTPVLPTPARLAGAAQGGAVAGRLERGHGAQIGHVGEARDDPIAHPAGGAGDDDIGRRGAAAPDARGRLPADDAHGMLLDQAVRLED